jgi:hypothetical protein
MNIWEWKAELSQRPSVSLTCVGVRHPMEFGGQTKMPWSVQPAPVWNRHRMVVTRWHDAGGSRRNPSVLIATCRTGFRRFDFRDEFSGRPFRRSTGPERDPWLRREKEPLMGQRLPTSTRRNRADGTTRMIQLRASVTATVCKQKLAWLRWSIWPPEVPRVKLPTPNRFFHVRRNNNLS